MPDHLPRFWNRSSVTQQSISVVLSVTTSVMVLLQHYVSTSQHPHAYFIEDGTGDPWWEPDGTQRCKQKAVVDWAARRISCRLWKSDIEYFKYCTHKEHRCSFHTYRNNRTRWSRSHLTLVETYQLNLYCTTLLTIFKVPSSKLIHYDHFPKVWTNCPTNTKKLTSIRPVSCSNIECQLTFSTCFASGCRTRYVQTFSFIPHVDGHGESWYNSLKLSCFQICHT